MENPPISSWKKAPPELMSFFHSLMDGRRQVEQRIMFGYPCAFCNGQLFTGLFEDRMFIRLPKDERKLLQALEGAEPFSPSNGRVLKEYILIPRELLADLEELNKWLAISSRYAASLPEKVKKQK
ncbi:MAG: TfoX/Sxy family protein [Anaerolineaceae bacterium]